MRSFLKYTLASLTGSILFFLLLGFLLTVGAIGLAGVLVANMAKDGASPGVEKDSVLVYDLSTLILDSPQVIDPRGLLLGGPPPAQLTLHQAIVALDAAAEDDRITALYLKGSSADVGSGLANQMELYAALERFKASGKPILAYDVSWSEREYHLASLADTIYLNPFGEIEMNGLYAETMYQAEALEKLGIGVQVTRVGKYKSAVEPLIRNSMSPEERQQTQRLLQDLWQTLLADTAAPRSLQPQQLQAIANTQGFLFGEDAKTQNLADEIAYEDEVITALRELTGEGTDETTQSTDPDEDFSFRQISLGGYARTVKDELATRNSDREVALLYAEGPIVDGGSGDFSQTQVIAGNALAAQLRRLRQDDQVKAVVLRINSPGGSATASEIILREVRLIQESGKPVVVSMGNVAASGGYWIASTADVIVAQPGTITGSIGVFSLFLNLQDLGDQVGVTWDGVKTAELADIFSSTRPKTEPELAILQKAVDNIYDAFLDRVETGRELPRATVADIAQGRIWSGKTAQELGLVDELGGLDQAVTKAAELADLGEDWYLKEYPQPDDWQRFLGQLLSPEAAVARLQDPLTQQVTGFLDDMNLVRTLNDPRGLYLLMPFKIEVQ
ncbi:MAG: signal peptide peptidase SppA [Nodosilinea sp.]